MMRLTLVMIVRDEAAVLPEFFAHHAGLWDEAVVVDTGSTDASAALARGAGARVAEARLDRTISRPPATRVWRRPVARGSCCSTPMSGSRRATSRR